jgi:hypothetical protein
MQMQKITQLLSMINSSDINSMPILKIKNGKKVLITNMPW